MTATLLVLRASRVPHCSLKNDEFYSYHSTEQCTMHFRPLRSYKNMLCDFTMPITSGLLVLYNFAGGPHAPKQKEITHSDRAILI